MARLGRQSKLYSDRARLLGLPRTIMILDDAFGRTVARLVAGFSVFACLISLFGCEKYSLNRKMEALCKVDGGAKIYETVTLPAQRFDAHGNLNPVAPAAKSAGLSEILFGNEYRIENQTSILKDGVTHDHLFSEGKLTRTVQRLRRIADEKILGESIWYTRIGGELTLFGMPSTYECPMPQENILRNVFLKGD